MYEVEAETSTQQIPRNAVAWEPWFAWYPVKINVSVNGEASELGKWVWMRTIFRKSEWSYTDGGFHYSTFPIQLVPHEVQDTLDAYAPGATTSRFPPPRGV